MIIQTDNLTKRYGATEVVSRLNLNVEGRSIYGFLGPNGITIFLSSHLLSEVEQVATHIIPGLA